MTDAEKITMVRTLADENDATKMSDTVITAYLTKAQAAIGRRQYPFGLPVDDQGQIAFTVEARYEMLQCELAARYINRRGGEGEIGHNENGVNRTYANANDEDLLCEVMQKVGV